MSYSSGSGKQPLSPSGNVKVALEEDGTGLTSDVAGILSNTGAIEAQTNNLSGIKSDADTIKADTDSINTNTATVASNTAAIKGQLPSALSAGGNLKAAIEEDAVGLAKESGNLAAIKADTDSINTNTATVASNTGGAKTDLDKLINALSSIATDSLRVISI